MFNTPQWASFWFWLDLKVIWTNHWKDETRHIILHLKWTALQQFTSNHGQVTAVESPTLQSLCNFTVLLYSSLPEFPNSHFLPRYHICLSYQLFLIAHSPASSFLSPSPRLICQGYIIFLLLLLGQTPPNPHSHSSSPPIECHYWQGVWKRSGESWDYPTHLPRDELTNSICVCVCVTDRRLASMCACVCGCGLWNTKQSLWLLERSTVIKLPLFHTSSCDCVMAPSFLLSVFFLLLNTHSPILTSESLHLLHTAVTSIIASKHQSTLSFSNSFGQSQLSTQTESFDQMKVIMLLLHCDFPERQIVV